jgi:hypothetical protein
MSYSSNVIDPSLTFNDVVLAWLAAQDAHIQVRVGSP